MVNFTFPRWYCQTNMEPQFWITHMDGHNSAAWSGPAVGAFGCVVWPEMISGNWVEVFLIPCYSRLL